ncbi:MAG: phosphohydrolase [Chitinophagaceae bacterium BSSC1]|nr:MAG: phosphohydrolase [Chitinophagaceae bacterium BSSC1]
MELVKSNIALIISLYEKYGNADYIGEPVSQLEHMCQSAQLAEAEGYSEEVILAAFFHDIGHLCEHFMPVAYMGGYGVVDHEKLGADFLRQKGFSERVCKLVQSHVEAKRYLTFKFPDYYDQLSEASRRTLEFQGGVMSVEEALLFEEDPDAELILALRKWDEAAKLESIPLPDLSKYAAMMERHLIVQQTNN